MNGNNLVSKYPVISNWDSVSDCPCVRKAWVNPSNVDKEKSYEKGDFLRAYCEHDLRWCDAEFGCNSCAICIDHMQE